MDRLKKQRGPIRTAITKIISGISAEVIKPTSDTVKLKKGLEALENFSSKLTELDQKILDAMLDGEIPEDEWEAENNACLEYFLKISDSRVDLNEKLHPSSAAEAVVENLTIFHPCGSENSLKKSYKLPKIELKKFSGALIEWLGWWAQFQKIDEDSNLHATDKFQYLVQSMKQGTRARDLVDRYPQSEENYPKVITALKDRFGKTKLLKQVYVRELISMIVKKSRERGESTSLSVLYDKLESHLRSLESLGVTVEQMVEFLFPMVESCLPEDILVAWQRSSYFGKDGQQEDPPKTEMDYLMEFLKKEIDSEEQRSLVKEGFGLSSSSSEKKILPLKKKQFKCGEDDLPTAAGLFNGDIRSSCVFCDGRHESTCCIKAQTMSIGVKKEKIKSKRVCFTCFKAGHVSGKCKSLIRCIICGNKHQPLLCPEHSNKFGFKQNTVSGENTNTTVNCTSEVVLQTLMAVVKNKNTGMSKEIRLLIDTGSQRSYITKNTIEDIGGQSVESTTLNHNLFGGSKVSGKFHNIYHIELTAMKGGFSTTLEVLDQSQICGTIPRLTKGPWLNELKRNRIFINDLDNRNPVDVEMLIGADNLGKIQTGKLVHLTNGLTATETKLGWTLMGQPKSTLGMNVISAYIHSSIVSDLWSLETIGIHDPVEVKSRKEKDLAAKEYFMQTVAQDKEGRYSVSLPWTHGMKIVPTNKLVAKKRLTSATYKLVSQDKYSDYDDILNSWEKEGIISQCIDTDLNVGCHYLPHRAVFKPGSKTTPVRPVFDASCKVGRSPSLNDCMDKGPNLLELIPDILHRFRLGMIGASADIRKAFLMIQVNEDDRDYLRFLWWEDCHKQKLKVFRHNRVVFGMNCSPFLLAAVIEHHLGKVKDQRQNIAEKLVKSLYVDNAVTSVNSMEELVEFKEISTQLMSEAKMELRQWEWSEDKSGQAETYVLGLKWNKEEDSLFCDVPENKLPEKITKRVILSEVQKVFDPLGFMCPALLMPKVALQKLWSEKRGWDDEVAENVRLEFIKWSNEIISVLPVLRIPRNATGNEYLREDVELHMFSDASKVAYAALVYLRVEARNGVSVQLLQAKSRVAPTKKATIPRLELLACTIGARLLKTVVEALPFKRISKHCWSDSSTALTWIKRNDDWGTFVGNRVREILSLSNVNHWRHVPGVLNPADLPSRGCGPFKLLESKWWEGPAWLKLNKNQWPSGEVDVDEQLVLQERKKGATLSMHSQVQIQVQSWLAKRNSFTKNIRILAFVLRYLKKLKKTTSQGGYQPSSDEMNEAELKMFQLIQREAFPQDESVISGLRVLKDQQGLIRVKTKLVNRQDFMGFRYPVLLPCTHPIVDQMIREEHWMNVCMLEGVNVTTI